MEKEGQSQKLNFLDVTIINTGTGKMSLKYIARILSQMFK